MVYPLCPIGIINPYDCWCGGQVLNAYSNIRCSYIQNLRECPNYQDPFEVCQCNGVVNIFKGICIDGKIQ